MIIELKRRKNLLLFKNKIKMTTLDLPKTMNAIVIEQPGGPEVMKYKTDVPLPLPAGKDEVLIKVDYVGVNYIDT